MESKPYGSELCRYMLSKLFLPINEGSKEKYMLYLSACTSVLFHKHVSDAECIICV